MVRLLTATHIDWYLEFFPWNNQSDIFILNWPISDVFNCNPLKDEDASRAESTNETNAMADDVIKWDIFID